MTSEKKLLANRSNAKKSTGPKTPRGKARSRYNALKNSLHANYRPLPQEDHEAYRRLSRRLKKLYAPNDPIEEIIVDQILGAIWRVGRLERADKAYLLEIEKSRSHRQACFDFVLDPLIIENKSCAHENSTFQFRSNANSLQAEIINDLDGTILEATISRAEMHPLNYLMEQRSAYLQEIFWLEDKLERRRRGLFMFLSTEHAIQK